jgi:uncharacterized protein
VIAVLGAVLAASVLGSLHCAAMCGPFVAFYAGGRDGAGIAHLAYNGGRLLTYAALGALAGAAGAAVDLAGRAVHVQRVAALLAGGVIVAWGTVALARALGVRVPRLGIADRAAGPPLRALGRRPPAVRAGVLGLLTAALPCGWLYAFVLAAASTAHPASGAAVMAVFWLGTVPVMLGLGFGLRAAAQRLGARLPVVTAAALLLLGTVALAVRVPQLGAPLAADPAADPAAALDAYEPACHGR